jgi:integrase
VPALRPSERGRRSRHFDRKVDAGQWLDGVTASVHAGSYVDPKTAKTTVEQWCATWLQGYATRRASTLRQAQVHVDRIVAAFGGMPLAAVRPSNVKSWTADLKAEGLSASYVYALHSRLSQVMSDAVHDGILARNPCSRRTSPGAGSQRPYVATTEQVWALHDAFPASLAPAVLLGAFVGLRTAEVCGLRVADVDFMRGIVQPAQQWPGEPLKTEISRSAIPIPQELALMLAPGVTTVPTGTVVDAAPWAIDRVVRRVRGSVGLPDGFRFHDLRQYFASLLIASGADVKVVQPVCGMRVPRRPWTPTATCGRTKTSPHEPRLVWFSRLVRTICGPGKEAEPVSAGQRPT